MKDPDIPRKRTKALEGLTQAAEKKESERPFNQPYSAANFAYWASMSYWTVDEAVALSFGKNPGYASWNELELLIPTSPFARAFAARRQIVLRAKEMGQLLEKTSPSIFLAWAERMKIDMPPDLIDAVTSLGVQIRDWKTSYDDLSLLLEKIKIELADERAGRLADLGKQNKILKAMGEDQSRVSAEYENLIANKNAIISERDQIIEAQKVRIDELESEKRSSNGGGKALGARERESLLKLTIGMAMKGYSYDPKSGRSPIAKEIAGDLALVGLPLDEDTVRKYLAEAKDLLPASETEQKS